MTIFNFQLLQPFSIMQNHYSTQLRAVLCGMRTFSVAASMLAIGFTGLQAQNSSYDADAVPLSGGSFNAGFGIGALASIGGDGNSALGFKAMASNALGYENVAVGILALRNDSYSERSVAVGGYCMENAVNAYYSTAVGWGAMGGGTGGGKNAAFGVYALYDNFGDANAAFGLSAMQLNTSGSNNAAIGRDALYGNTTGYGNTALGSYADGITGSLNNATAIGGFTIVDASDKVRIGNAAVTVVEGPVFYTVSDGRFKTNVRSEDVVGLDFIQRLRPVVYNFDTRALTDHWTQNMNAEQRATHLNRDFGPSTAIRQSGFIAQEVEQAAKEAGYNFNGVHVPVDANDNYSVSYSQFVVPLVKAVQEQQAQIADLQAQVRALQAAQGTQPDASAAMSVFPNPSHGSFTIEVKSTEATNYEVRDIAGRLVARGTLSATARTQQLNLASEAKGTYVLRVFNGERLLATEKLILE
jgi:hypothetical protein